MVADFSQITRLTCAWVKEIVETKKMEKKEKNKERAKMLFRCVCLLCVGHCLLF